MTANPLVNSPTLVAERLAEPFPADQIKTRERGEFTLTYMSNWAAKTAANYCFGPGGWNMLTQVEPERCEEEGAVYWRAKVRIVPDESIGLPSRAAWGVVAPFRKGAEGAEIGMKGAVTDAFKVALSSYGPRTGLQLYSDNPYGVDEEAQIKADGRVLARRAQDRAAQHRQERRDDPPSEGGGRPRLSFAKLPDDTWGIRIPHSLEFTGMGEVIDAGVVVDVIKRDGAVRHVTLGARRTEFDNEYGRVFDVAGDADGS
ncbi:MAG: Rad52/Rad22 family DNA repair protein [Acidobacteria bacterium]|nr:Rad52/Rad22 family DNA repair protein [Acidobacteriota bacterium]